MKTDKPLEDQFFYHLEKTNKLVRRYAEQSLEQAGFDLTIDQWLTLKKIYDAGEISQVDIAEALFKDKASVTRILNILLRKRLIQKSAGADKRIQLVTLSLKGKELFKKSLRIVADVRATAIKGLSSQHLNNLQQALDKINLNLR